MLILPLQQKFIFPKRNNDTEKRSVIELFRISKLYQLNFNLTYEDEIVACGSTVVIQRATGISNI